MTMYDPLFDLDGDGKVDAAEEFTSMMMFEDYMKDDKGSYYTPSYRPQRKELSIWHILVLIWVVLEIIAELK